MRELAPQVDESEEKSLVVISFYKFADFPDHADQRKPLKDLCDEEVRISRRMLRISGGGERGSVASKEAIPENSGFQRV
ncbi:hypothetical protein Scep_014199 [Stephania cephalantha]|uniref:Uncharacterized protein n=1 Tax=Stephania cephalantha TaxID=152367 RepID=A0AAP0J0V8_9MAGN